MIKLEINNKIYKVKLAITDEEKEQGLQGVEKLPNDEGMLFVYDEPEEVSYWMQNCPINLDIVFINEDDKVIKVSTAYANTEDAHTAENCLYVLEVNQGSGIMQGDSVEIDDTKDEEDTDKEDENLEEEDDDEEIDENDEQFMTILNSKGKSQMELKGGERIFSRKNTKSLLKFAKRAYTAKTTTAYKTLGKKVFAFMTAQDNRDDEYVDLPK